METNLSKPNHQSSPALTPPTTNTQVSLDNSLQPSQIISSNTSTSTYANITAKSLNIYSDDSIVSTNVSANPLNPKQSKILNKTHKKPDYSDDDITTPKKDQGLIIEAAEGLKIKQYIEAVGEIIGCENIIYASRMSRDRICLYLNSKNHINEIIQNFDSINIEENILSIRPLILRAKKFYLNSVCPSIPSSYLHDKITELGINITSKIQRERMTNENGKLSHIFSFRRTFYGIPEKNAQIPDSILLHFDHENHRIFLSTEIKRCSKCHKIGHLIEKCGLNKTNDTQPATTHTHNNDNNNTTIPESQNVLLNNATNHTTPSTLNINNNNLDMIELSDTNEEYTQNNKRIKINDSLSQISIEQQNIILHHGVQLGGIESKKNGAQSKTPKFLNADGMYAELDKYFKREISSELSSDFFISFVIKLSKKEIDEDEIKKEFSPHIKELTRITETLRGITVYATKARLTRTLARISNVFQLQNPKFFTRNNKTPNELETNSVEHVQFSSTD